MLADVSWSLSYFPRQHIFSTILGNKASYLCWRITLQLCATLLTFHGRLSLCFHTALIWVFTCKWDTHNYSVICLGQEDLCLSHQNRFIYGCSHLILPSPNYSRQLLILDSQTKLAWSEWVYTKIPLNHSSCSIIQCRGVWKCKVAKYLFLLQLKYSYGYSITIEDFLNIFSCYFHKLPYLDFIWYINTN